MYEMETQALKYWIIYPAGDRRKLTVVDIAEAISYEINDYSLAYRDSFASSKEAIEIAKALALKHNKEYQPFSSRYGDDDSEYLTLD